jgi:hypothetical protein
MYKMTVSFALYTLSATAPISAKFGIMGENLFWQDSIHMKAANNFGNFHIILFHLSLESHSS